MLRAASLPLAGVVEIYTLAAQALVWLEEWARAGALVDALLETLREVAAVSALIYPTSVRAWLDYRLGSWDAALAGASEAVRLGTETEQWLPLTGALGVRAWIHATRGDAARCVADAELALGHTERLMAPLTRSYSRSALGLLALGDAKYDEAVESLGSGAGLCEAGGIVEPGATPFAADLVEAHIRLGAGDRARELLERHGAMAGPAGVLERIDARTVVWAAGVTGSPLARMLAAEAGADLDRSGRLLVEPDLTVPGYPDVLAVGDMAAVRDRPPFLGVAPVAMQQGRHAARVVRDRLRGRSSRPFRYRDKGNVATIGRARAVVDVRGVHLSGLLAWMFWLGLRLYYLIGFQNRLVVLIRWIANYVTRGRGARLITGEDAFGRTRSEAA